MKDILILEDGPMERERLEKLFLGEGYSVRACSTVGEAEQSIKNDSYRLAVLDIGLSDKSGSYFFNTLKRSFTPPYIIIFTGNPSVHLKERFMSEGAADYIVKATAQAQNENLLNRVRELIGKPQAAEFTGLPLETFLREYVSEKSHSLFLDMDNNLPVCRGCGSRQYVVEFKSEVQLPPDVKGHVICSVCGKLMNLEVE